MALKDEMVEEPQQEKLTETEERDLSITVMLAQNLIDDAGEELIESSKTSKDQGQVLGQFIFQMGTQLGEQLKGTIALSPRIFLGAGGWIEQVSDYLQDNFGVPKDVMDRAELYVGGMIQKTGLAKIEEEKGGAPAQDLPPEQQPAPNQPPTMPQAGGM